MKVLVVGAKGFLGQNIINYYSEKTNIALIGLSRAECDFSDHTAFSSICSSLKPDLVVHAAVSLSDTLNNLQMYLSLEKSAGYFGKAVMIGSGAEYGDHRYQPLMAENYFDVRFPPTSRQPYHISKYLISRLHQNSYVSNIYNFRVFGLYGPYEDYTRRLISNNIYTYLTEGYMQVSANHAFDYLYAADLVAAIDHFATSLQTPKHNTYNLCSGRSERFYDILVDVIETLGGTRSDININSAEPTTFVYSGDPSAFEDEFDYSISKTSFSQGTIYIKDWLMKSIINVSL